MTPPRRTLAYGAGVVAATALVFARALAGDFVNFDDLLYVGNEHLRSLDAGLLRWAVQGHEGLWIPVTWCSYALDRAILGEGPLGYHLVNVALHAVNAALVFGLARRLFRTERAVPAAAAAALLFALHPLRVESVAWVAERKDVLSGAFALAATHAYLSWAASRRPLAYGLSVVLYALALGAKPSAVPLPLAWLLLDAFPLRRGGAARLVAEKLPHLACAAAVAAVTASVGANSSGAPLAVQVLVAAHSVVRYLALTVWPAGLHALYWYPPQALAFSAPYLLAAAAVAALTAGAVLAWRRAPGAAAAWLGFLLLLAPTSGIVVHSGPQAMADHYTYLASVPLALAAGGALAAWGGARRWARWASAAAVLVLAGVTVRQIGFWRDTLALWDRVLEVDPDNGFAYQRRVAEHVRLGRPDLARADLARALAAYDLRGPYERGADLAGWHRVRGTLLAGLGRVGEALAELDAALGIDGRDAAAYHLRARLYEHMGLDDRARLDREAAARLAP